MDSKNEDLLLVMSGRGRKYFCCINVDLENFICILYFYILYEGLKMLRFNVCLSFDESR